MNFTDAVAIASPRKTRDGYLVADARIARTGIYLYRGSELGKPEMETVRVYRPESSVFADAAMASFAHRPITVGHPAEGVTADNWKSHAVGSTDGEVVRDGQFVRVPMILMDKSAIDAVEAGTKELSAGYTSSLTFDAGETPQGEPYDAVMNGISGNHVAIVPCGRAGSECRIGDGAHDGASAPKPWGIAPLTMADTEGSPTMADNLRTVVVDGLSVSVTDQGAQAIEKLTRDRDEARKALADAEKAHADAIKAKDEDLAKKDAAIDAEKAKVLSDADLDKRVQARADLVAAAAIIAKDVKTAGLSDAEIRKAVVTAKLGDAAVKDKSEAYIDARFDILAEDAAKGSDRVRQALGDRAQPVNTNDNGQDAYEARLRDAWKEAK